MDVDNEICLLYALGIKIQIWFSNAYKFIQKFPLHLTQGHRYIKTPQKCSQHWDSFQKCSKGLRLAVQHNLTLYKFVVQNKLQLLVQILICVENGRYYSYNVAYCFNEAPLLKIIANFPLVSKQAKQHILTFTK